MLREWRKLILTAYFEQRQGKKGRMMEGKVIRPINELNLVLVESLAAIIKPIVMEAVQEVMGRDPISFNQKASPATSFLTIRQAAEASRLGASTIRLLIRRRELQAQKVGRRVLVKRNDLESFLESAPIQAGQL